MSYCNHSWSDGPGTAQSPGCLCSCGLGPCSKEELTLLENNHDSIYARVSCFWAFPLNLKCYQFKYCSVTYTREGNVDPILSLQQF